MREKSTVIAFLAVALSTAPALAQEFGNNSERWIPSPSEITPDSTLAGKIFNYSATLKLSQVSESAGECADAGAHRCLSGTCVCTVFTGSGTGPTFGTVAAPNLVFELTTDVNAQPGDPDGTCYPSYGFLFIPGSKETEEIDLTGAACNTFSKAATHPLSNPPIFGTDSQGFFNGGFEFDNPSSAFFYDGNGQATGKYTTTAGAFQLKLKGKARHQ